MLVELGIPTWSWCMITFMCCWIWFGNILLRIFASVFIKDTGLLFSLWVVFFVWVWYQMASQNVFGSVLSSSVFWESLRIGISSFYVWQNSPMKPSGPGLLFIECFFFFNYRFCFTSGNQSVEIIYLFFFKIFIGVQLLYNVMLFSAVPQLISYTYTLIPSFWISFPFRTPHNIEQSSHLLSILYIIMYICLSQFPYSFHIPPLPLWSPYICSLHLYLCFCFSALGVHTSLYKFKV